MMHSCFAHKAPVGKKQGCSSNLLHQLFIPHSELLGDNMYLPTFLFDPWDTLGS